jgi:hypothetical protein
MRIKAQFHPLMGASIVDAATGNVIPARSADIHLDVNGATMNIRLCDVFEMSIQGEGTLTVAHH